MEDQVCSKCAGVLDTEGYPLWCKACRAKYKREYEKTRDDMTEKRAFSAGAAWFRDGAAQLFDGPRTRKAAFSGQEVANALRSCPTSRAETEPLPSAVPS